LGGRGKVVVEMEVVVVVVAVRGGSSNSGV
jgi:hypothetical protein